MVTRAHAGRLRGRRARPHLAGQHYLVRLTAPDGYRAQRSYSVATPPTDNEIELTVERLPDGEVSTFLHDEVVVGDTIEEQTARVLENVKAVLEAAGASMADVVKSTVHLSDVAHFSRFDAVYATYFPEPRPVRTTVGSQLKGILVEIDVIAYVGD